MKHEIKVAMQEQAAIPEIGREAKTLYWLIIGEGEDKITINTGKATYDKIKKLEDKPKK